jgi:hypothetical protein
MKRLCTCILLLLVSLSPRAWAEAEGQSGDIDSILKGFPGWHVLTLAERDSDTHAFFHAHFPKRDPSVVHADFDGDGRPDYAILLKNGKSGAAKLVVLLCSADTQCKNTYEVDVTSSVGEVYIRPVPLGSRVSQTDAIDNDHPAPARLSSTGIEVTYFGQAKVVYYWNRKHKKVEAIQTED